MAYAEWGGVPTTLNIALVARVTRWLRLEVDCPEHEILERRLGHRHPQR